MTELDFVDVIERFDEILDAVEQGERFRVLRNGRPIAVLEAAADRTPPQADIGSAAA